MHKISQIFYLIVFLLSAQILFSQVKIGDNPSIIDANSILELESNNKVLVITRLNQFEISALKPLSGAIVYNTDAKCVFVFDGSVWKNLCDNPVITINASMPSTNNSIGDFWFNNTNNVVSLWDGSQWLPININPRRGNGAPTTSIFNALAGDIYVDQNTGDIFTYNGTNWVALNQSLNVNNGVSLNSNVIQLGGSLVTPTVITTNGINTLAIQGLEEIMLDDDTSIVVVNDTTGELKKIATSNLIEQFQVVLTAVNGQIQFNTPLPYTDIDKLDVYRNGTRVAFTAINPTTIELEPEALCYNGDEIRIVQLK